MVAQRMISQARPANRDGTASPPPSSCPNLVFSLSSVLHSAVRASRLPLIGLWVGLTLAIAPVTARADAYDEVNQKLRAGRHAEAQTQAERYLQGKPRDPQMRYLLGLVQRASGKPDAAMETFTRLITEYPELPEPHNALASLYASRGDYEQARISLERAIRARPDYATALENLGDLQIRLAEQAYCLALKSNARNDALRARVQALGMQCP
jgi:tetratricopeptide (TPR) repeat protein